MIYRKYLLKKYLQEKRKEQGPKQFRIWLEYELWEEADPDFDPYNDFFNMAIELDTGEIYSLNVWTRQFFNEQLEEQLNSDNEIERQYFVPPDLIIEKMDRELITEIANEMIINYELKEEWKGNPDEDEP